jgi:serine/threonine protein kinase/tetratricopeptide (TPR) repeat protein
MSTLGPDWWLALSPYLEQALEMSDGERADWLESLRDENPALAAHIEALLAERNALEQEHFLEQSPSRPPAQLRHAGGTVGPYTLVSQIGQGGMGSVWLAERSDGRFERRVAVKFLSIGLAGRGGEQRFKREGSILGRLAHPHIAELVDAGVSPNGQPYLVLEHVDGEQIEQYCDRHVLSVDERVQLFLDVLAAVAHAHANLIVHRDIKPSNVLVRGDGKVKLLDFGIAKLLEADDETTVLTVASAPMTPEYAAPEQLRGEAITIATDVYALGVLLYVLLTGQHPAGIGPYSPADLVKAIVDTEPRRLSDTVDPARAHANVTATAARRATTPEKLRRLLHGDLDTIVAKAMKKDPRERYPSVTAFADDLRRCLDHEPISARPDTLVYRAGKFVRRNRSAVALVTLAAVATAAGIIGTLMQSRTARQQRDLAFRQLEHARAVGELDTFLLSDAAPSGKPFTVNELLARAEHMVARQHDITDANRVDLLISIGMSYNEQEDSVRARPVLEEAYRLSRRLSERSTRADASCTLAGALAHDEELTRAEALFQEGLRELAPTSESAFERFSCLLDGSMVAAQRGDAQERIARVQAAQMELQKTPFRSDASELRVSMELADAYRTAGRNREAILAYERGAALLTALGRDDTETGATWLNNWALTLYQSGRVLESEKVFRRAIEIERAGKTEDTVSPMTLNNYAKALQDLGHLDEAADYAERAYTKAKQMGQQLVINQSLLERARIYRDQRDFGQAAAMLAEVEPRLQGALPAGHYAFAMLASEKALVADAKSDFRAALRLADQAVSIDEAAIKAGGEGSNLLPVFLVRRSMIELDAQRADQAETDAARARNLLQVSAPAGTFSSNLGHAYLTLGRALRAQGRRAEARTAFQSAAENLQNAVGPDHPDTRIARQFADADSAQE